MMLKFPSVRIAVLSFGLAVALGAGACAMAQPAAPPGALTAQERLTLREERRAERQAVRNAEQMARLEGRIAFLRSRLMIAGAQAPLWEAFAEVLRNEEVARAQARLAPRDPLALPPSLPERLERRRAELTAENERLQTVMNALTPLYTALSAEQRVIADRLLRGDDDGELRIRDGR